MDHIPNLFYGIASITYVFKLLADYYQIPINVNFDEMRAIKCQFIIKVVYACISAATFIFFVISLELKMDRTVFRVWTSMLFFITCIGLVITALKFLKQYKKYDREQYEDNKKGIIILTSV